MRRRRTLSAAAAAAVVIVALAAMPLAFGGEEGGSEPANLAEPRALGEPIAGSVAALAQCRDWRAGTVEEKMATLADIREALSAGLDAPEPIPDEEAFAVFERACANEFAAGFRLYKLYYRAAGFDSVGG